MSNYTNLQTTFRICCGPVAATSLGGPMQTTCDHSRRCGRRAWRHEFLTEANTGSFAATTVRRNTFWYAPERQSVLPIEMTALPLFLCWLLTAAGLIFIISEWRSIAYSTKSKHLVSVLLQSFSHATHLSRLMTQRKRANASPGQLAPFKLFNNKGRRLHLMDRVWSHDDTQ